MDPTELSAQLRRRARPETVHTATTSNEIRVYADVSYWHDRYAKDAAFEWFPAAPVRAALAPPAGAARRVLRRLRHVHGRRASRRRQRRRGAGMCGGDAPAAPNRRRVADTSTCLARDSFDVADKARSTRLLG